MRTTAERNRLVEANLGLVHLLVNRLGLRAHERDEAIQNGSLGLLQAASTWNPETSKFSTYAVIAIRRSIGKYRLRLGRLRIPYKKHKLVQPITLGRLFPDAQQTIPDKQPENRKYDPDLDTAFRKLPTSAQKILNLYYNDNHNYRTLSTTLKVKKDKARELVRNSRKMLATILLSTT